MATEVKEIKEVKGKVTEAKESVKEVKEVKGNVKEAKELKENRLRRNAFNVQRGEG